MFVWLLKWPLLSVNIYSTCQWMELKKRVHSVQIFVWSKKKTLLNDLLPLHNACLPKQTTYVLSNQIIDPQNISKKKFTQFQVNLTQYIKWEKILSLKYTFCASRLWKTVSQIENSRAFNSYICQRDDFLMHAKGKCRVFFLFIWQFIKHFRRIKCGA